MTSAANTNLKGLMFLMPGRRWLIPDVYEDILYPAIEQVRGVK